MKNIKLNNVLLTIAIIIVILTGLLKYLLLVGVFFLLAACTGYYLMGGTFDFFVKVPENRGVFIYRGGKMLKVIINQVGKKIVDGKIVDGIDVQSLIVRIFGYWFIDWSPTANVNGFTLKSQYTTTYHEGTLQKKWATKNPLEYQLWLTMPFRFIYDGLEGGTGDNAFKAGMEVQCRFEVVDPYLAAILSDGNLFYEIDSVIGSHLAKLVAKYSENTALREADRTEGVNSILYHMKAREKTEEELANGEEPNFNNELLVPSGVRLIAINAPELWIDIEEEQQKINLAKLAAKAQIEASLGQKTSDENIAVGKAAYPAEMIKVLKNEGDTMTKVLATLVQVASYFTKK